MTSVHEPSTHPVWFKAKLPERSECSQGYSLFERAKSQPDLAFLVTDDNTTYSTLELYKLVTKTASRLQQFGIGHGDRVMVWLPTGLDMVRLILAISMCRATIVPLNPALRGNILSNAIKLGEPKIIIAHPELAVRLEGLDTAELPPIAVTGNSAPSSAALKACREIDLPEAAEPVAPGGNDPWDIAAIIFSSGTTGPAKGVMVPYGQLWSLAQAFYGYMNSGDRMLLMYPLYHIAGYSGLMATMITGASAALTEAFSASQFWNIIRRTGATTVPGLGPTFINILLKPEATLQDSDNTLRHVNVQAISVEAKQFSARFGCTTMACYSMTETSGIAVSPVNGGKDGSVGRPRDGVEVRIVDQHDVELPAGMPGELIVRAQLPWILNTGYFNNPAATAAAWQNGWFHTGDVFKRDADGDLYFVDRTKDVIRRRSENISSSEIEAEARAFPAVQDAAAIGVLGDDEILIAIAPIPGHSIDPQQLIEFMVLRMPHHMVPRFVRILPALPKTHTNRVQKATLRDEGVTPECWDRHVAGIVLRGKRLGAK